MGQAIRAEQASHDPGPQNDYSDQVEMGDQGAHAPQRPHQRARGLLAGCQVLPPQSECTAHDDHRLLPLGHFAHLCGVLHQVDLHLKYTDIFFDLDGTLWDLKRNTRVALEALFNEYAGYFNGVSFDHLYARYHHHNDHVWALYRDGLIDKEVLRVVRFERTFMDCSMEVNPDFARVFANRFLEVCPRLPHLVPGAMELLQHLHGRYAIHIITNGFREVQGFKLEAGGITDFFSQVIYSEVAGVRKPHRGIFELAFSLTHADPSRSLMVGDDWEADILGARDAGMDQAFLTSTEELLHELGTVTTDRPRRHNHQPTYSLSNLSQLLNVL